MPNQSITCCFTGHRAAKLPWGFYEADPRCIKLKQQIYDTAEAVYASGIRHFICGMANGCDMYFGEAILQLKLAYPDVILEAAIPYSGQADHWKEPEKSRWQRLYDNSDYITVVSQDYTKDCMNKRNRYMVDHSSVLIAAYNGTKGGTQNTMLYAIRSKCEVIQIPVDE